MDKRWIYWIPVYLIAVVIFYYSSLSSPLVKGAAGLSDWILHLAEYGVFSLAVYFAFSKDNRFKSKLMSTVVFVFLFAVSDELHQLFVPGRVGSLFDVAVDVFGSFVVIAVASVV